MMSTSKLAKTKRVISVIFNMYTATVISSILLVSDVRDPSLEEEEGTVVNNIVQSPYDSVFFIMVKTNKAKYICSAFAVSKTTVLTAAHCLDHREIHQIEIRMPDGDKYSKQITKRYSISDSYDSKTKRNDYAAVFLSSPVKSKPFCLASFSKVNKVVQTTGFPGSKQNYPEHIEMWSSEHQILQMEDSFGEYSGESESGQSGSPVFTIREDGESEAYGVLSQSTGILSGEDYSRFHSFNNKSLKEIRGWISTC
jgi:V8-like Glu-specific endopeptidase